jgi:Tetratricopeptide repeat
MTTLAHTQSTASVHADLGGAREKPIGFVRAAAYAVAFFALMTAVTAIAISQGHFTPRLAVDLLQQSEQLSAAGDTQGALAVSRRATEIYRGLMRVSAIQYAPKLAASLHDLSLRLSEAGDGSGALAAIQEAVKIRRQLANESTRFAAILEQSLQLLARMNHSALANMQSADSTVR